MYDKKTILFEGTPCKNTSFPSIVLYYVISPVYFARYSNFFLSQLSEENDDEKNTQLCLCIFFSPFLR